MPHLAHTPSPPRRVSWLKDLGRNPVWTPVPGSRIDTRSLPYWVVGVWPRSGVPTTTGLERDVAIKFLRSHLATEPEFLVRFFAEAQSVARINHPNVVSILDFGSYEEAPYLVMELVEGGALRRDNRGAPSDGPSSRTGRGGLAGRRRGPRTWDSSIGTSSRPTSSWAPTARPRSPTSGSLRAEVKKR